VSLPGDIPLVAFLFAGALSSAGSTLLVGWLFVYGWTDATRAAVDTVYANPLATLRVGFVVALGFAVTTAFAVLLASLSSAVTLAVLSAWSVVAFVGRVVGLLYVGSVATGDAGPLAALLSAVGFAFVLAFVPLAGPLLSGVTAVLGVGALVTRAGLWAQDSSPPVPSTAT
jgi:hypothetical protein